MRSWMAKLNWLGLAAILGAQACAPVRDFDAGSNLASGSRFGPSVDRSGQPVEAEFSPDRIAPAFREIVFRYEFHFRDGRLIDQAIPKPLKRWQGRVRYRLVGDGVTERDIEVTQELVARLGALTGLDFQRSEEAHDLLISIASPEGRKDVAQRLDQAGLPGYRQRYEVWQRTPSWQCGATLSSDAEDPNRLVYAHVFLRAESSTSTRVACLHEEITQSLGLTNDSDKARPSIFNDDHEFKRLTRHDRLLVKTLYDPRLRAGMSADEAMPVARQILGELMAGPGQI